jgi:DNA-directed RNA polymerase alpha subunit
MSNTRGKTGLPTASQSAAAVHVMLEMSKAILNKEKFREIPLSSRTIDALMASGIDAPERLLFKPIAELKKIPGIGKAALAEITRYRERFLPRT